MKCSCGGEYRCDKCGAKVRQPTQRQIQAYMLVHVHGFTQEDAGDKMGITQKNVSVLLTRLNILRPHLFRGGSIPPVVFRNDL